jgi:hypothetical protein
MLLGKEWIVFIFQESNVTEELQRDFLTRCNLKDMQHLI